MTEFRMVEGFEEVWRPPVALRRRTPEAVLSGGGRPADPRARLARIVRRAPEVMVKVTGRTRDGAHLKAHLDYISRHGGLELEDQDGAPIRGREDVRELAADWSAMAVLDPRRRAGAPLSRSLVLSMPAGTDPIALRAAARAFASEAFGESFDYVFALHTDTPRPHVHLSVWATGRGGERLNPKKADLEAWRQAFAQALRDRGVEAEATPRRARGVSLKPQRTALRKIADRHAAGRGRIGLTMRAAYRQAAEAAFGDSAGPMRWEARLAQRQVRVRALYLAQARVLLGSDDARDRALGAQVERFVREMPAPDSRRLKLARELREASVRAARERGERPRLDRDGKDRT
jgi:hypothetical protein